MADHLDGNRLDADRLDILSDPLLSGTGIT
jgi:hypothetical protein